MRNIREIAGNIAIIGGLVTSGVSVVDIFRAGAVDSRAKEIQTIKDELQEKYDVREECSTRKIYGADSTFCATPYVSGEQSTEEKRNILHSYQRELTEKSDEVFNNSVINGRYAVDSGGMLAGIGMMAAGIELKSKEGKQ